jgi:hypothetical protein
MASVTIERPRAQPDVDDRRRLQAFFDDGLATIGERAPAPVLGQDANDYLLATCRKLKKALPEGHELRAVNYGRLNADVLYTLAPQLLKARVDEAKNPDNCAPGEIRMIVRRDINGKEVRDWIGRESFVRQMTVPGRRVVSFVTSHGRYDAAKARYF